MLAGSLPEFPLPDVLALLAGTRKTGVLTVEGPASTGRIWIAEGGLAHAVADRTRCPLAGRLVRGGDLELLDAEALMTAQGAGDPAGIGAVLQAVGLGPDRIRSLVTDELVDALVDLAGLQEGSFEFTADAAVSPVAGDAVPHDAVLALVAERRAEWDGLLADVPPAGSVLAVDPRPPAAEQGPLQVTAEQWAVLALVDGSRTWGDVVGLSGLGAFAAARVLAGMVADGLVRVVEEGEAEPEGHRRARAVAELEQRLLGGDGGDRAERPADGSAEDAVVTPLRQASDDPRPPATPLAGSGAGADEAPATPPADVAAPDLLSRLIDGVKGA